MTGALYLCVVGHVFEDAREAQQHNHDCEAGDHGRQRGAGAARVVDGGAREGAGGGVRVEERARDVGITDGQQLLRRLQLVPVRIGGTEALEKSQRIEAQLGVAERGER